jgi:hypothetical protein
MSEARAMTGAEAGLSSDELMRIALEAIAHNGGTAQITDIYAAVERKMGGAVLSEQGRASLREVVNRKSVKLGYIYPSDSTAKGWRITPEGKKFIAI